MKEVNEFVINFIGWNDSFCYHGNYSFGVGQNQFRRFLLDF